MDARVARGKRGSTGILGMVVSALLALGCGGGGGSGADAGRPDGSVPDASAPDAPALDTGSLDAGPTEDAGPPDTGLSGDCEQAGADGTFCVCGCGRVDPDCPTPADVEDCDWDGCDSAVERPDPANPSQCRAIDFPDGWTCGAAEYVDDVFFFTEEGVTRNSCTCGCGAVDDVGCAAAPATLDDCETDACGDGRAPDQADLTGCVDLPAGWTCSWERYYDGRL